MGSEQIEPVQVSETTERRFNAHVVWARGTGMVAPVTEVAWLEIKPAQVFGSVFVDLTDKDLHSVLMAPDLAGRFRGVEILQDNPDLRSAVEATAESMVRVRLNYDEHRTQGDEKPPIDFFAEAAHESKLHPLFVHLRDSQSAIAARRLIEVAMRWYENQDGTFVKEFQTSGYDARIWELYLWAVLREAGYWVEQPKPAPDFLARGDHGDFYVEATTANRPPSELAVPIPDAASDYSDYLHNYLPSRFSGPLCAKLEKKYWSRKGVDPDTPFVVAVQDFHQDLSMTWSQSALYEYLYGVRIEEVETNGVVRQIEVPVAAIRWGTKEFASGFFNLPEAEHVSAVMCNPAGTLTKFNRMGIAAGMGHPAVRAVHEGRRLAYDNSGREESFSRPVTVGYAEDWVDGLTVFHNPRALHPLSLRALPGAAHVYEEGGIRRQYSPAGHLVSSVTHFIYNG